jgi:hypothetical protein
MFVCLVKRKMVDVGEHAWNGRGSDARLKLQLFIPDRLNMKF